MCIDGRSGRPLWRSTIGGRAESGLTLTGDLQVRTCLLPSNYSCHQAIFSPLQELHWVQPDVPTAASLQDAPCLLAGKTCNNNNNNKNNDNNNNNNNTSNNNVPIGTVIRVPEHCTLREFKNLFSGVMPTILNGLLMFDIFCKRGDWHLTAAQDHDCEFLAIKNTVSYLLSCAACSGGRKRRPSVLSAHDGRRGGGQLRDWRRSEGCPRD